MMLNLSLATIALAAVLGFYCFLDGEMEEKVIVVYVPMWHCDGWEGKMYPTERSMRRAFK